MIFKAITIVLLTFVPLIQAAESDAANDNLNESHRGLNIDWVVITAKEQTWPSLPLPSLRLGDEFQFDPEKHRLPSSFEIMPTEVSCAQLLQSKRLLTNKSLLPARLQQLRDVCEYAMNEPVTGVSFLEASAYCAMVGGQLPSEAQWVLAASLDSKAWLQRYGVMGTGSSGLAPKQFTAFKQDVDDAEANPGQLYGIVASVWEITRTPWLGQQNVFVMKGGAFDLAAKPWLLHPYLRAAFNGNDIYNQNIGFRCVREPN